MKYLSVLFLLLFWFISGTSLQAQTEACSTCYSQAEGARLQCESWARVRYLQSKSQCDYLYCNHEGPYNHWVCNEYYHDFCLDAAQLDLDRDISQCYDDYWRYIEYCEDSVCVIPAVIQ